MATDTRTCLAALTSNADFQAWVQAFEGCLVATGGMVHDSGVGGQIDPTTVARPATNTDAGFRVYKFNDAMHTGGTRPIYLKVLFGIGSSATIPRLTYVLAETTAFSGRIITATAHAPTTPAASPAVRTFYGSGGDGRVDISSGDLGQSGSGMHLHVERLKDLDGVNQDVGVQMLWGISSATYAILFHSRYAQSSFSPDTTGSHKGIVIGGTSTMIPQFGGDILLSPIIIPVAPDFFSVSGVLACLPGSTTFVGASPITADFMGASHTWLPIPLNLASSAWLNGTASNQKLILWE